MDDLTLDTLRTRLRSAQASAAIEILRPPVTAVHDRLRRRRKNRAIGAALSAVGLAAAIGLPLLLGSGSDGRSLPSVRPSASPSVVPSPSPSSSAPDSPPASATGSAGACVPTDYASFSRPTYKIIISGNTDAQHQICPGETIRVFWAKYVTQPDGSQTLYSDHIATLTTSHPTDISNPPVIPGTSCDGDFYVVTGSYGILARISAGNQNPYPQFENSKGGTILGAYGDGSGCAAGTQSPGTPAASPMATATSGSGSARH